MADLKSGTTIGGNTVFTQGNLPIVPSGTQITYRGWRMYTEKDRPNNVDVGLGNVTNDAQVKKSGDTMTGPLIIDGKDLTVGNNVYLLQKTAGVNTTMITARADTALKAGSTIPTTDTEQFSLQVRHQSTDSNPLNGPLLSRFYAGRRATSGAGVTLLQAYAGSGVNASGVITPGDVTAELTVDGAAATVNVSKGTLVASAATLSNANVTNLNVSNSLGIAGSLSLTARNAGIEIGSLTQAGTSFIDFHTSGNNTDFDYRLSFDSNGLTLASASGIAPYDVNFSQARDIKLNSAGASGIKGAFESYIMRDQGTGNVCLSASRTSASATTGGDLYVGYSNPAGSQYTNSVILGAPMFTAWGTQIVNGSGKLIATSLDGGAINTSGLTASGSVVSTNSGVYAATIIEAKPPSDPAFTSGQFYNTPELRTRWNTRGATSGGPGFGYVSFYGQEQVGTAFRACISVIGYNASPTWQFNQDGSLVSPGPFWSDHADGFRIRQFTQNKAFIHRFDGTNYYMLLTDSVNGSWNGLRPITISGSSGLVTMNNGLTINGGLLNTSVGVQVNSWMQVAGGLNVGSLNGNSWGGASITIGDTDSGIRSGGDGVIQIWCNNARTAHFDTGQAYFDRRIQGPAGASITDVNVYAGDLNQSNDGYSTFCRDLYVRSDIRVKKDLRVFPNAALSLSKLGGYLYLQKKGQNEDGSDRWIQSAGLIAQEVQDQYPELVTADNETGLLRLNYNGVIGLNTAAINEHTKQIAAYEEKIAGLETTLESVLARLAALENK